MNNFTKKIKVSLIVPFYGVEAYIEDCIKSLINQNMSDMEIILIDYCSPDNSLAIAEKYAKIDNRIKIIKHEVNKKQGGARNTGLANAQGEYIWFIDSDDYLVDDSNIVSHLYNQAMLNNVDWLMFDIYKTKENKKKYINSVNKYLLVNNKYVFTSNSSVNNFLINHYYGIAMWRIVYKRNFLQTNKLFFPENACFEDRISPIFMAKADVAVYVPQAYYIYRKRRNSATTSKINKNDYKDYICVSLAILNLIDTENWNHVYLGSRLLLELLLFLPPLVKEFNDSSESHKQKIVEDMANTIHKIADVFNSKYFDEALAFGNIDIPKKHSKEDLVKIVHALKNSNNQDNLKKVLYEFYTKLNKDNKIKKFISKILRTIK
jgi:glycosyltransferase involved in cell wall biosynthesis